MSADNQEMVDKANGQIVLEALLLSFCSIGLIFYITVATFVFRKIGFTNPLMWMIIASIGMVVMSKSTFSQQYFFAFLF